MQLECENITQHCHNNGDCIWMANVKVYECSCYLRWDPSTNCSVSFHHEWAGSDAPLYIILLLAFSVLTLLFLAEVIIEVLMKPCSILWKMNFGFKIISVITTASRILTLAFWAHFSNVGVNNNLVLVDQCILGIANVFAFAMYYGELLMWMGLFTRLKNLSNSTTQVFKKARNVVLITLLIFFPLQLGASILYTIFIQPWINTIYFSLIAISLIGGLVFSSIYVIQLHYQIRDLNMKVVLRKNYLLGITNIFMVMYLATFAVGIISNASRDPHKYLAFIAVVRVAEFFLLLFILLTVENYLLMGRKEFSKAWATRSGVASKISSSSASSSLATIAT